MTMIMTYSASDLITHMPYDDIIDLLRCSGCVVQYVYWWLMYANVFRHFPTDWSVLSAVLSYQLYTVDLNCYADKLDVVFPLLVRNLNSPYHKVCCLSHNHPCVSWSLLKVRLLTLKILQLFEQPLMEELNVEEKDVRTSAPLIFYILNHYNRRTPPIMLLVMSSAHVSIQRKLICHF